MKIQPCKLPLILTAAVLIAFSVTATAQEKKKIATANDLPRFSYPMDQAPSAFLLADDATYNAFVATVLHDVNSVLNNYDIEDKATLRALYGFKVDAESLMGENEAALKSLQKLKDLQEKPEAKATVRDVERSRPEGANFIERGGRSSLRRSIQKRLPGEPSTLSIGGSRKTP